MWILLSLKGSLANWNQTAHPWSRTGRSSNVTACLGTRNCKFGIIDSVGLAEKIDKKFFGKNSL